MSKLLRFCAILSFSLALLSCGSSKDELPVEESVQVSDSLGDSKLLRDKLPSRSGVFLQSGDTYVELRRGIPADLQVTNADRGFAFMRPIGEPLDVAALRWIIKTKTLSSKTAQISAMRGVAILPNHWYENASPENLAWIASETISTHFQVLDEGKDLVSLTLDEALKPGFYVLHDHSFLQAVQRTDVSAFYPFVIAEPNATQEPWTETARACFRAHFDRLETAYEISEPTSQQSNKLRQCAVEQQLANVLEKEEGREALDLERLVLSRIAGDDDQVTRERMAKFMSASGDELEQWLWWRVHSDVLIDLSHLQERLEAGETLKEDDGYAPLLSYYLGELTSTPYSMKSLIWLPFYIAAEEDSLQTYFEQIIRSEMPIKPLILWLGAYQLSKMRQFTEKNQAFVHRLQFIDTEVPRAFREASRQISHQLMPQGHRFSSFIFEGIESDDEKAELVSKIKQKERGLDICFRAMERRLGKRTGVLIVELPLISHLFGREATISIRDPLDSLRSSSLVDADFVQCTKRSLNDLVEKQPGIENIPKRAIFALIFNSNTNSAWLQ